MVALNKQVATELSKNLLGGAAVDYVDELLALAPLWGFRGDSYEENAGKASAIYDLSPNARDGSQASSSLWATLVPSSANFNNRPTFSFPSGGYYDTPSYSLGPFTLAIVGKFGGTDAGLWGHGAAVDTYMNRLSSDKCRQVRTSSTSGFYDTTANVGTTARLFVVHFPATSGGAGSIPAVTQRWNGVAQTITLVAGSYPSSATMAGASRINGWPGSATFSKASEIAEMWMFPPLTTAQITLVENRLMTRYGFS